ncbi:hypothetical protein O6H91_06G053800 [Diphasiastrum complanatum]|uniref:Uncharacterized protein n=1 Tax=Diphasiastrum complanatum TaxID=34168 RepID=A0ACC2DDI5_DIPCM|nr:hypothetical protein O6H91_06G053800 [Diphasiastrum complanatum]
MDARVEELLKGPILLAERTRKAVEEADSFKQECADLSRQVEKLAHLLRQAARVSTHASGGLYLNPCKRITEEIEKTLEKALALVKKCKRSGILKRVFTITSATDFRKLSYLLDNAIGDMTWFLTVSARGDASSEYAGLPPIAANDPILALIWEQIAHVQAGSAEEKLEAAAYLATLAADNERNGKIIIEEGGLPPLLKLLSEGAASGQESAATALGVLASDQQRVQEILKAGALQPFLQIVIDAPMKVQIQVVIALANMVSHDPETQNAFGVAIRHLVALLVYETIEEPVRIQNALNSMHTLVKTSMAQNMLGTHIQESGTSGNKGRKESMPGRPNHHSRSGSESFINYENSRPRTGSTLRGLNRKEREQEDPQTKMKLKADVARALWKLAANNVKNSKSITDTRALLCFAKLIENGEEEVQRNSIMAVMEIAAAAEKDQELRKASFKMTSPAVRAIVEQLLRIIGEGDPEIQVPALRAIGCLARMFPTRETRVVRPLTAQLANADLSVATEAAIALQKFTTHENYLCVVHSKTVLEAFGAPYIVKLATFGGEQAQIPALILLCNIALHAGDDDTLKKAKALRALEASSRLAPIMQMPTLSKLIPLAIENLKLYQPGAHQENGFE